jgi:hypothetical protein
VRVAYHLELRQFPHNANRFNLDRAAVMAILASWVADRPVELGERHWSPQQARITIIEGPELVGPELSLGRGWRVAERRGTDVTRELLAEARAGVAGAAPAPSGSVSASPLDAKSAPPVLPAEALPALAALLGPDAERLLSAWSELAARAPGLTPSEALALAERKVPGGAEG